jgi:hypothetical protein
MCEGDHTETAILGLLDTDAVPWADEEIVREIGDRVAAVDALASLHGAGLVHRCAGFVWTTRAARRCEHLA